MFSNSVSVLVLSFRFCTYAECTSYTAHSYSILIDILRPSVFAFYSTIPSTRKCSSIRKWPLPPPIPSNIHFITTPALPLRISVVSDSCRILTPFCCQTSIPHSWSSMFPYMQILAPFTLNPHFPPSFTEVDRIFDHPFEAVLDPQLLLNSWELLVGEGEG
jgi:hypothetical protein